MGFYQNNWNSLFFLKHICCLLVLVGWSLQPQTQLIETHPNGGYWFISIRGGSTTLNEIRYQNQDKWKTKHYSSKTWFHRAPCTGHKDIKHRQSSFGWIVTFSPLLRRSSTSLSVLARVRHVRSLYLRSKLQPSVRYKEPARPICFSRQRPLHQYVTCSMPTLSFLSFVFFNYIFLLQVL